MTSTSSYSAEANTKRQPPNMTITILDGGLGQELVSRYDGQVSGLWGAQVMMQAVHTDYFNARA